MSAHEQMRAMLDQLMGTGRDGEDSENKVRFDDPRVCKSFLLGCCPHEILSSTRMDLGECPKHHELALKADFEMASKEKDYYYDIDAMEHLQSFIADCDRRTELAKRRLKDTQEELSDEAATKADLIHDLGERIGTTLAKAEEIGAQGNVEESLKLMQEVEELKVKKSSAEADYRNSMPASSYQQQKLRVCEVCSAYLGIHDNDRRLADHFGGKLHLGFIEIRQKLTDLQNSVAERKKEREERRAKEREEQEKKRKEAEERRNSRRKSRSKSRRKSRSRSRKRSRTKSRSKSRDRRRRRSRSRSRSKDRRRRSRSRSRDRRRRRSRSKSRSKRSRRSRSKSRSRRSRSRDRRRRRSRSRSRKRSRSRSKKRSRRSRSRDRRRDRSRSRGKRSKDRDRDKKSKDRDRKSREKSVEKEKSSEKEQHKEKENGDDQPNENHKDIEKENHENEKAEGSPKLTEESTPQKCDEVSAPMNEDPTPEPVVA